MQNYKLYMKDTLFKKENFKEYDENDFFEKLTFRLSSESKNTTFSYPKKEGDVMRIMKEKKVELEDYFETFESLFDRSIEELRGIRNDLATNMKQLVKETEEVARRHKDSTSNLHKDVDVCKIIVFFFIQKN